MNYGKIFIERANNSVASAEIVKENNVIRCFFFFLISQSEGELKQHPSRITRTATKSLLYVVLQLDQTFIILLSLEARGAKSICSSFRFCSLAVILYSPRTNWYSKHAVFPLLNYKICTRILELSLENSANKNRARKREGERYQDTPCTKQNGRTSCFWREISFPSSRVSSLVPSLRNYVTLALSDGREREKESRREFVTVACEFWRRHLKLIARRWQDIWSFMYIERLHRLEFLGRAMSQAENARPGLKCLHFQRA